MTQFSKFFDDVVLLEVPKAKIKYKNESKFMKFLNIFVGLFNKKFMTSYITTIGNTVYFPNKKFVEDNDVQAMRVLAHELVHLTDREQIDNKNFPGAYGLWYLFPQCLSVLSLLSFLAFININFLFFLCFLICLAPLPSPGRVSLESRGYVMTMFVNFLSNRRDFNANYAAEVISELFVGPSYYWMSYNKERVIKRLVDMFNNLPQRDFIFRRVLWWTENNG